MASQRKTSISSQSSLTGKDEYYTPYHHYNTRLSAKYLSKNTGPQTPQLQPRALGFPDAGGDCRRRNADICLIEEYENSSDHFSVAGSNCFEDFPDSFIELEDISLCEQYLRTSLVKVEKPMDLDGPPCPNGIRARWLKNGCIIAFIVVVIGLYVNHVRTQLDRLKVDVESANGRISDIVDSRLDTIYKLSETNNMMKDLKQSQANFKQTIQKMIEHEINKMYNDKTGLTDYALESAGGRIAQLSPGTENYGLPKSSLLGISLCDGMNGPRAMIQTGTSPGECWAFKGSNGGVIVKLLGPIKIDAVSMEHISKNISPAGDSSTAPKDFTVWGLNSLTDRGVLLGQFSYKIDGPLVQTFSLSESSKEMYDFIELRILSNHGHSDFTCIYRFRVHGTMENPRGK